MPLKYPFLDLKPVNEPFEEALKKAACDVIGSGRYINGEYAERLEKETAALCNTPYAVAVSNGLDALRLIVAAYKEMGIFHNGDEVIIPANTYIASALAVSCEGLKPVFADISPSTLNLDTRHLEQYITERTVAIMPVHLYGTPCWDKTLIEVAKQHNLKLIEDNAQAIGAETDLPGLHGTYTTGGLGDAAGISFYPTKNLGALGDAGMVTTHDKNLASTIRALANYGAPTRYNNMMKGYNCRMDEIQAAMLLVKLPHLKEENNRRRTLIQTYNNHITHPLIASPRIFEDCYQVWHQYPLRTKERDRFCKYMKENGVATDIIYPLPVYKQHCYKNDYQGLICHEAEKFAEEVVCLPIGAHISIADAKEISEIINRF